MKKALSLVLTMCIVLSLFATFVVSASAEATNVALNKSYTITGCGMGYENLTGQWPSSYTANLTDGAAHEELTFGETKNWFSFYYKEDADAQYISAPGGTGAAVVDLGSVVDGVNKFRVHLGNHHANGVADPVSFSVYYSVDGVEYTKAGDFELKDSAVEENAVLAYWSEVTLDTAVSARYVKFEVTLTGVFAFLNELEVYADPAAVATKVLNLDRANHYDWTNKDYQSDAYVPTALSAGEILLAASATDSAVGNRFGGNYFTYWYVILAEWDAAANAYVVTEIDLPGDADGKPYEAWTIGEGKLVVLCNTGYASTEPAGNADDAAVIKEIVVGDKLTINGSDWATLAAASGALEGVSLTINAPAEDKPETIVETITVDGNLNDTGWNKDKWITVNDSNGYWQNADSAGDSLEYKYQIRADEEKVYVAVEVNETKQVRFWVKDDAADEDGNPITVYTHFYDVVISEADGQLNVTTTPRYNTSTTENKGNSVTDAPWTDSSFEAKVTKDGKYYVEMSFDADEFASDGEFEYYICVFDTDSNCLYSHVVPVETEDHPLVVAGKAGVRLVNLPYNIWYSQNTTVVDVEAIQLGEVVVTPEEPEEQPDTSMMGTAPTDSKFTATVSGPEAWKAGDKITVDVTIEVTADELELSQIMFNLFYDAADVEITLPENLGTLVTEGPDSWKGEDSLFTLTTSGDYGVIEAAPATVEAEDVLKKGDKIVISFEFTVKEEAEGLINFQLSNEELNGFTFAAPMTAIAGTGSSLAIAPAGDNLGDAGIYAIAALAIVALIGTAVVIKKRA